jgi:hypothetical protein
MNSKRNTNLIVVGKTYNKCALIQNIMLDRDGHNCNNVPKFVSPAEVEAANLLRGLRAIAQYLIDHPEDQ